MRPSTLRGDDGLAAKKVKSCGRSMECSRIITGVGLAFNLAGTIILAFFVHYIQRADGNAMGHSAENCRYFLGWLFMILGFVLQIVALFVKR